MKLLRLFQIRRLEDAEKGVARSLFRLLKREQRYRLELQRVAVELNGWLEAEAEDGSTVAIHDEIRDDVVKRLESILRTLGEPNNF